MWKKWWRWRWAFILVVIVVFGGWLIYNATHLPERSTYLASDLTSAKWQKEFDSHYRRALSADEAQGIDPKLVALSAAGYPNDDNIPPESVATFESEPGRLIFVIASGPAMDDSISLVEWRVDLIQQDGRWQVEWAGRRWVCGRDLFRWGWTTRNCS
jgi:hypothetical protein